MLLGTDRYQPERLEARLGDENPCESRLRDGRGRGEMTVRRTTNRTNVGANGKKKKRTVSYLYVTKVLRVMRAEERNAWFYQTPQMGMILGNGDRSRTLRWMASGKESKLRACGHNQATA